MIRVFEAFAGVGAQRMALKKQGVEHEVTAISEVDEYAILSYHAIHTSDTNAKVKKVSEEEMQRYMEEKNIPLNPKGERKILKNKRLKDLYVASVSSNNLGDISKITDSEMPKVDLFTYSFPCQDISQAGKKKGLDKNSGTRSSLLWECERIIEVVKPKYLLMENVKALVNKNNRSQFDIWLEYLGKQGYKNFWQVLNAKDYGIPQNRERVFVVSILDENADYKFPNKIPLTLKLKDILEDSVGDGYYLSQEQVDRIAFSTYNIARTRIQEKEYSDTLCARDFKDPKCVKVRNENLTTNSITIGASRGRYANGRIEQQLEIRQVGNTTPNPKRENPQTGRTYDADGLAPTLNTMQGGNRQPQIIEPKVAASRGRGKGNVQQLEVNKDDVSNALTTVEKDNYVIEPRAFKLQNSNMQGRRIKEPGEPMFALTSHDRNAVTVGERVVEPLGTLASGASEQFRVGYMDGLSKTLKANKHDISVLEGTLIKNNEGIIIGSTPSFKIRKLTPNECWRLMGITDEDFKKASRVVSNSQLYKQAGNSIVVDVLEGIFKQLFDPDKSNQDG